LFGFFNQKNEMKGLVVFRLDKRKDSEVVVAASPLP
jgi:hypothetical protein